MEGCSVDEDFEKKKDAGKGEIILKIRRTK